MINVSGNTASKTGIADICFRLGRETVDINWLEESEMLSAERTSAIKINGTSRYFRSDNKPAEQLAIEAAQGLFEQTGINPRDIQFFIFTSTVFEITALYPDLPAQRIARATGCQNAKTFSLQHVYCVSPLAAIKLLRAYFADTTNPAYAIVVCADAIGSVTEHLRAIETSGVHSDGAAAILLTNRSAEYEVCDIDYFTNVSKFLGREVDGTLVASPMYFAMIAKLIRILLVRNRIPKDAKIDLFTNNLDLHAWRGIGKLLNIPAERIHFDQQTGHVFGADPFITLKKFGSNQADYCLLAATAVAGTVGAALLKPNRDAQRTKGAIKPNEMGHALQHDCTSLPGEDNS